MNTSDVKTKWRSESIPALIKERDALKKKYIIIQLEVSFGKIKKHTDLQVHRKNIARLETVIQEKLMSAGQQNKESR